MGDAIVRKAAEADLDAIYEIEQLSFKDPYPPGYLKALRHLNPKTFYIAEREGAPVGYIVATADRGRGHILAIAVHPAERRKHVGQRLIAESLKDLRGRGVKTVRLEVRRSNVEAQRFYEELGFQYAYTIEAYYDDEDGLVYYASVP
jgi:ribosomal-protein-alanine N-acetyltransferase